MVGLEKLISREHCPLDVGREDIIDSETYSEMNCTMYKDAIKQILLSHLCEIGNGSYIRVNDGRISIVQVRHLRNGFGIRCSAPLRTIDEVP